METDTTLTSGETEPTFHVTLVLHNRFSPQVTTEWLGVVPSRAYLSDQEVRYEQANGEWGPGPWWSWELDSRLPIYDAAEVSGVTGLDSHIRDVLDQVDPSGEKLAALPERGYWVVLHAVLPLSSRFDRFDREDGQPDLGRTNAVVMATADIFGALWTMNVDLQAYYVLPGSGRV